MRVRRPWDSAEQEALRVLAPLGARACAEAFDRSLDSIKQKARELGVSLRRRRTFHTDSTLCRGEVASRRVRELALAPLCPACGRRPVTVKRTGLCAPCHYEALIAAHKDEIAKADAQRELWAARSKLQRRRRSLAAEAGALTAADSGDAAATMRERKQSTDPGRPECGV